MAETQRFRGEHEAVDVERAAGALLVRQPHIVAPGKAAFGQSVVQPQFRGQDRLGLGDAVEVERHGEMLGDVALPGRRRTAIRLQPALHQRPRNGAIEIPGSSPGMTLRVT